MTKPPKVSVIIPVKNGLPYLVATLESLQRQTMQDFEVLVWDNGSDDGTLEILREWIPEKLPGRVVVDDPLPLHQCLAKLVEQASAEYLARLDADDLAPADRLAIQAEYLDNHADVAAVGGQMDMIDEAGRFLRNADHLPQSFGGILATLLFRCPLPHPGTMFRRSKVLQAGNYAASQPIEDLDLWLRLAKFGKLVNLPQVVVKYRLRPGSVTAAAKKAGDHTQRIFECLQRGIPELLSIDSRAYARLLGKAHPLAISPLHSIAGSIARLSGLSLGEVMRLPEFLESARCLTGRRDILSKLVYFWLGRDRTRSVFAQAVKKANFLPGICSLAAWRRRSCQRRRLRRWIGSLRKRACTIESVEVRGNEAWERCLEIGDGVSLEKEVAIYLAIEAGTTPRLRIGPGAFIGRNTSFSVFSTVDILANSLIGAYCYIASNNHCFASKAVPIKEQGYDWGPVSIGPDAWLGTHVVVLPNVTIGEGAIVGAGSVVTRDVPPYEIWGGVPAKRIKARD
jgi:acetyltransferase-like isoleucine patch superfamily enzyme